MDSQRFWLAYLACQEELVNSTSFSLSSITFFPVFPLSSLSSLFEVCIFKTSVFFPQKKERTRLFPFPSDGYGWICLPCLLACSHHCLHAWKILTLCLRISYQSWDEWGNQNWWMRRNLFWPPGERHDNLHLVLIRHT